ncbi:alpha-1,2-fucosyltransferase [Luteolibacter ambystomatis]|uniref:Alpha-1,2-fucosyltransferase n=1 Tax=Luteolibacter ambystomatis TaxID=2824561 RepID=A0A975G780_9BACT|nr:alpha-1,2-fucosyltransferase [Luteolibacter ambystomatis]QUE50046.1 alpha-1,2-fucosyltransferase [Luteolibacter ambystomatis]
MKATPGSAPVVSLVKGGLGNQMFCYAAGRALALRLGRELQLDVRTGFQRDDYGRSYRLNRFPIIAAEASEKLCLGGDTRSWSHKLARTFSKLARPGSRSYVAEKEGITPAAFVRLTPAPDKPTYLNGYWQDETYFAHAADRLRKELAPPVPTSENALEARRLILSAATPVMLHIRRERYTPRLDEKYYNDCISACIDLFPDATFFVFGDDFAWAREHLVFEGASVRFLDRVGADEIEDLHLMTCCRHAIVANSSFSWWGAWLGHHPGQQVWTPADPGWPVKPAAGWTPVANDLER